MDSVWINDAKKPEFPPLQGNISTDVLVIGGGLAGILCAYRLTCAGADCVLVEENRLMGGVSGRTTAKLTSQHGLIYAKLLRKFGEEKARLYWQANASGISAFRSLPGKEEWDWQIQSSYLYATEPSKALEEEMAACERLGIPARWETGLPLPFPVTGAIAFPDQAQFHPLKLAAHLTKGLKIHENTKVLAFLGDRVQTSHGTVTADNIIVATHFPLWNKHGAYFLKLYQQRSYITALSGVDGPEGMYLDCKENGLSLRHTGQWLLLGGGGHRTGKDGSGWSVPETAARQYYPHAHIAARWATQDCMSLDGMPYIGQYSQATPNLYVATGFQKWGMSTSMVAATVLTDLVCGRESPYAQLFSPSRSILHRQLFTNGVETVTNLLRPAAPRCPHLGCALRWNKQEHSWDCACHGSRFDSDGRRCNGPATDDLPNLP